MFVIKNKSTGKIYEAIRYNKCPDDVEKVKNFYGKYLDLSTRIIQLDLHVTHLEHHNQITVIKPGDLILRTIVDDDEIPFFKVIDNGKFTLFFDLLAIQRGKNCD